MRGVIRFCLGLLIALDVVVVLGHIGDRSLQPAGEWLVLELSAIAMLVGTVILFRYVGDHWATMSTTKKVLVSLPAIASLWWTGQLVVILLAIAGLLFLAWAYFTQT
jgi:hypothetical protein